MKLLTITLLTSFLSASLWAADTKVFGAGDFSGEPVKLTTLLKEFDKYKDKKVVLTAQVEQVCQKKGCWVKVEDENVSVRAIMKDHAFSVPQELQHKTVKLEGKMVQKEIPVNAVKHFMRDEGKTEAEIKKVDKPQKVFQFIADAVKVG